MVIKGTVENPLQPAVSWSPRAGRLEEQRVQILAASLATWEANLQAAGYEYRFDPIGQSPLGIITYKQPQETQPDEALSDVWAVRYLEEQRTIWALPAVQVQLAKITDETNRALFRADIEAMVAGQRTRQPDSVEAAAGVFEVELTFDTIVARSGQSADSDFVAMARRVVADLGVGADVQFVGAPVLVRASIWPAGTALNPVFRYINAVCTTPSLLAYETTIPANIRTEINATLPAGYWLMKSPTLEQQEDGRWRYSREYWGLESISSLMTERLVVPE